MLNWLRDIYNGGKGVLSDIEKWLAGAINAVYSYFDSLISQIWTGLQRLANAINSLISKLEQSLYSLYTLTQWIITKAIPQLANWAWTELGRLRDYAIGIYHWAISELARLEAWAQSELNKVIQWVIHHIWDPLWTAITTAIRWIEREGAFVYYLLTHPDKLAAILAQYVLGHWMNLGKRFARPFVRWIVHNTIAEVPTISSIIEDILASLF
jgi:hypothetical protein